MVRILQTMSRKPTVSLKTLNMNNRNEQIFSKTNIYSPKLEKKIKIKNLPPSPLFEMKLPEKLMINFSWPKM